MEQESRKRKLNNRNMKERLKTQVNSAQLFMLVGVELDLNRVKQLKDKEHEWKKTQKCSLQEIADSGLIPKTQSPDERYDKKCPVLMAVESLYQHGLPMRLMEKVLKSKPSAEKGRLVGAYRYLSELLNRKDREFVEKKLNECWDYYRNYAEMP